MPLVLLYIDWCEFGLHILSFWQFANCLIVHQDLDSLGVDADRADNLLRFDAKLDCSCADKIVEVSLQKIHCAVVVVLGRLAIDSRLQIETSH